MGLLRTRGAAQLLVEDDAERRDVVRATEIASPVSRRIERAVRLVVPNFLRLGQQVAVVLRVVSRPLDVAGESADRIHRLPPAQRDDLGAIVQIANRNQRAEIAWRRTVVGEAGVADVGDVFVGQLAAKLAPS